MAIGKHEPSVAGADVIVQAGARNHRIDIINAWPLALQNPFKYIARPAAICIIGLVFNREAARDAQPWLIVNDEARPNVRDDETVTIGIRLYHHEAAVKFAVKKLTMLRRIIGHIPVDPTLKQR
jgi:hypothetical protein